MAINQTKSLRETSPLLPTMSMTGWAAGIAEKIDLMLAYYMASHYNQTVYHKGFVRSMAYTVQQYYNQPDALATNIKMDLESILAGYVDYVYASVKYEERENKAIYDYHIDLTINHAEFVWDVRRAIRVKDSKFEQLAEINNGKPMLVRV